MKRSAPALGFGVCVLAVAMLGWAPVAEAQFFWSPFFQQEQPKRQKVRPAKPKTPADDLPPIIPRESSTPPPPDDRPYDAKLLRLAEILGAVHYLRELCGAQEGQLWRDQMKEIVRNEGSTAVRRAKLVNSFNDGYRGYRRTYRSCTSSATLAITRFSVEGAQIAAALAKPSHYASRGSSDATSGSTTTATDAAPVPATGNAPAASKWRCANPRGKTCGGHQARGQSNRRDTSDPGKPGPGCYSRRRSGRRRGEAQAEEAQGCQGAARGNPAKQSVLRPPVAKLGDAPEKRLQSPLINR